MLLASFSVEWSQSFFVLIFIVFIVTVVVDAVVIAVIVVAAVMVILSSLSSFIRCLLAFRLIPEHDRSSVSPDVILCG